LQIKHPTIHTNHSNETIHTNHPTETIHTNHPTETIHTNHPTKTIHTNHPTETIHTRIVTTLQERTQPISLFKVRVHTKIAGNEMADSLAKNTYLTNYGQNAYFWTF
jgi:ribonuclease HI